MNAHLIARFAAIYAGLALVAIGAGLGAYAFTQTAALARKVDRVRVQQGDPSIVRAAAGYVVQVARQQGLSVTRHKLVWVHTRGDTSTVRLELVTTAGPVTVDVHLTRSVWAPVGVAAA